MDGIDRRQIEGFPGYAVSRDGTVWTCKITGAHGRTGDEWRPLAFDVSLKGYCTIKLTHSGKSRKFYVHRLVAEAFIGPLPGGMQTRHRDGNPLNNAVDNLAYGTPLENGADAVVHGRHYRDNKGVLTKSQIPAIRMRLASGDRQVDIAADFGVKQMTISDIKNGKTWAHVQ